MKTLFTQITTFLVIVATSQATCTKFVHVCPGIKDEKSMFGRYAIDQAIIIPLKKNRFRVAVPISHTPLTKQRYWRITCVAPCHDQNLNFRSTIWEYVYGKFSRQDIEKIESLQVDENAYVVRIDLSEDEIKRTYIYRDYPRLVMDGGYYYCVDIPAYFNQYIANQNLQPTPKNAADEVDAQGGAAEK